MLPIYEKNVLVGTLQVLFSEAHSFHDLEVRMYRLILGLVEEAIGNQVQHAQKRAVGDSFRTTRLGADSQHIVSSDNALKGSPIAAQAAEQSFLWRRSSGKVYERHFREFRPLWIRIKTKMQKEVNRPWSPTFIGAALTGAIVVLTYNSAPYRDDPARSALHRNVSTSNATGRHAMVKPPSGHEEAIRLSDLERQTARSLAGFKRIRIGPKEVHYVAADVTIRRFTAGSAGPLTRPR